MAALSSIINEKEREKQVKIGIYVLALVVGAICGLHGTAAGAEQAFQVIWEESFEKGDPANPGFPPGWTVFASAEKTARSTEEACTGDYSLRMDDNTDVANIGLRSPYVPAAPGKKYAASAWVLAKDGSVVVYLEFWDAAMTRIGTKIATLQAQTQDIWQQAVIKEMEAPANSKYATVLVLGGKASIGLYYFDDIQLTTEK